MRPRGSYGEIAQALRAAAAAAPGTVRELAGRACVGYAAARYTASRLASTGVLVAVDESRPAVLALSSSFAANGPDESTGGAWCANSVGVMLDPWFWREPDG